MLYSTAVNSALRLAQKNSRDYFVIRELNESGNPDFHVASDYDLDTYFQGISPDNILFCTFDHS